MSHWKRREVLVAGARAAAGLALGGLPACGDATSPQRPNILLLITDQERHHVHWPVGWVEANLPSWVRLQRHGLTFERAYAAAAECSPSRAVMLTGEFSAVNRVPRTLLAPGLPAARELMNVGRLLAERAGYDVVWKGKWHLSYAMDAAAGNGGEDWSFGDIRFFARRFGWSGWNPPDAGNAIQPVQPDPFGSYDGLATLGGGTPDNDGRYVRGTDGASGQTPGVGGTSVLDYLKHAASHRERPFFLAVSLVNPHDVGFYPIGWDAGGYRREDFAGMGIGLPTNYADDLVTKPGVQLRFRQSYQEVAPLTDRAAELEYVNFYAYLHTVVDAHVGRVLDALDEYELTDDTVILRLSDHGELGLSHGLREKSYTAYEEMIRVPLVVSNPKLYPEPMTTRALYSHLDLLPTIAEIAGISDFSAYGRGVSAAPVLRDPRASVQESVLYSYDDVFFLPADAPGGHIRGLRAEDWTYAVYFADDGSGLAYELYDLASDPGQLVNLAYGDPPAPVRAEWSRLHAELTRKLVAAANLPDGFPWPTDPAG
jgi:arylsulfatase A-like enzyme